MRRPASFIALLSAAFVLTFAGPASAATASMTPSPTRGPGDQTFAATYLLAQSAEEGGCPGGEPVAFTWQSASGKSTPLGTATLAQSGDKCTATLRTTPPEADRTPGNYTICGTYTKPDASTVGACEDYVIDAQAEGSPGPTGGGTGGTPGAVTPTGAATGAPSEGHGTGEPSPGETGTGEPSPHATGEGAAEGAHPPITEKSTGPVPGYVALALILGTAVVALRDADTNNPHH